MDILFIPSFTLKPTKPSKTFGRVLRIRIPNTKKSSFIRPSATEVKEFLQKFKIFEVQPHVANVVYHLHSRHTFALNSILGGILDAENESNALQVSKFRFALL